LAQFGYAPRMAQTWHRVRIEEDSEELLEALSVRGLEARPVEDGEIEVAAFGEEGIWNLEVVSALEAWLEEEGRPEVVAHVGDAEYTVRLPGARPEPDEVDLTEEIDRPRRRIDPLALVAALGTAMLLAAGVWLLLEVGFRLV
jgi:hypothetical protein